MDSIWQKQSKISLKTTQISSHAHAFNSTYWTMNFLRLLTWLSCFRSMHKNITVTLRKSHILPVTDCENNPTSSRVKRRNIAEKLLPKINPITRFYFPFQMSQMSKRMKQSMCRSNNIFFALFSGSFNTLRNASAVHYTARALTRMTSHQQSGNYIYFFLIVKCKYNIEYIGNVFIL